MFPVIAILIFYVLFVFIIKKLLSAKRIQLSAVEISIAFGFKILLGCLYGYIYGHYYGGDDTWAIHATSLQEKKLLVEHPVQFFREYSPETAIRNGSNFWQTCRFYIADLEYCLLVKTLGYFNLISRGNYYINIVFFNFIVFWGHYWLFRLTAEIFPTKKKMLFFCIFLFPPVVFWLSGLRADGLLFFFLSLLFLHFQSWTHSRKLVNLLNLIIGFAGVLIMRPPFALLLIPALIAWLIIMRFNLRPLRTFLTTYFISAILFFATSIISSRVSLPAMVVRRQQEFFNLKGNTVFKLDSLQPDFKHFAIVLPQAINNSFFRPYPWEWKGILQLAAVIESLILLLAVLMNFWKPDQPWRLFLANPLVLVFLFFSVSLYLFIGYTVPFPGAIVRYKIIPELLLFCLLALHIKWEKIIN